MCQMEWPQWPQREEKKLKCQGFNGEAFIKIIRNTRSNFCLPNGCKTDVLWRTILIHSRYNIKYVTIKSSAGEATVSDFDIEATNGVVHIVDHVFWFVMLLYHTSLFCQIICCSERICVFFQFGRFFQTFLLCSSNFAGQGAEKVNIVFK